jgi:hypothetical protein
LASEQEEIELSFAALEHHLGFSLPASARRHAAWWSNSASRHSHARAWLAAGRIARVDLGRKVVRFERC